MSTTRKLRLGLLPRTETTKLSITCPARLKADLDRYPELRTSSFMAKHWTRQHRCRIYWRRLWQGTGSSGGIKRMGYLRGNYRNTKLKIPVSFFIYALFLEEIQLILLDSSM